MARLMQAGLAEALSRPDAQIDSHSTLQLFVVNGAQTRRYFFATGSLNFDGVIWQPQLRQTDEINSDLTGDGDEAVLELQNVDTVLGIEFVNIRRVLSGSEALVGRYWKDLDFGTVWHDVFLTGVVTGLDPNEMVVRLTVVSDEYSGVSVGPLRKIRRLCPFDYKGPECGRPVTDPPTCDFTLHGAGGCHGRWGDPNKFIRHGGAPFIDAGLNLKII